MTQTALATRRLTATSPWSTLVPCLTPFAVALSCTWKDGVDTGSAPASHDTGEPTTADGGSTDTGEVDTGPVDADAGGVPAGEDCDDSDPDIHPGATEVCDEVDNDCDDLVDDADPDVDLSTGGTWYTDMDRDGYGVDDDLVQGCEQPKTAAEAAGDCDAFRFARSVCRRCRW